MGICGTFMWCRRSVEPGLRKRRGGKGGSGGLVSLTGDLLIA